MRAKTGHPLNRQGGGNSLALHFVILLTNMQQSFGRSYLAAGWRVITPRISRGRRGQGEYGRCFRRQGRGFGRGYAAPGHAQLLNSASPQRFAARPRSPVPSLGWNRGCAFQGPESSKTGTRRVAVNPPSGRLLRTTSLWLRRASWRAMPRPRPVPPVRALREPSRR